MRPSMLAAIAAVSISAAPAYAVEVYNAYGQHLGELVSVDPPQFVLYLRNPHGSPPYSPYAISYHMAKDSQFDDKAFPGGLDWNFQFYYQQPKCTGPAFLDATDDNVPEHAEFDGTTLWSIQPNTARTIAAYSVLMVEPTTGLWGCYEGTGSATWVAPAISLGTAPWNVSPFIVW